MSLFKTGAAICQNN